MPRVSSVQKPKKEWSSYALISILLFVFCLGLMVWYVVLMTGSIYQDELVFVKITQNLPSVSTSASWLTDNITPYYHSAYDTVIWIHPLLPNYLMFPVFKVINPLIPSVARAIPLILIIITMLCIADVIRREFGIKYIGVSVMPFLLSGQLLGGGIWLYWDCFMWVFFALSLWLIYVKPESKWLYLTITAMLLSKEISAFLIMPLAIAYYNKLSISFSIIHKIKQSLKLLTPLVALVLWEIQLWVISGDMLYYFNHWSLQSPFNISSMIQNASYYLFGWGLLWYFLFTIPGFIISIKNKKYCAFGVFYLFTAIYGIGWGCFPYQVFSMLFSGMFLTVLSVRHFTIDSNNGEVLARIDLPNDK